MALKLHQEIIFYDYEFNILGRIGRAADIYHKELYNGIGSFEAEIELKEPVAQMLLERDYVVAVWDGLQAIITSVQAKDDQGTMKIYGRTPNWILAKRSCPNFGHRTGTPFELAHQLVDEVWGDSIAVGMGRDIEAEETTFWRNVYNPLDEVVSDCLDRADGGHRVVYDVKNREWRFETYKGEKRELVFSADRRNAGGISLSHSVLDYFNGGFYTTDYDNETWIEIPSDKEGIYKWTSRLNSSGASSAKSELAKRKIEDKLEFSALDLFRGDGYQLGDIVRASREYGGHRLTKEMRVTAVERWAGYDSFGERPVLEDI
ncbi:MAG: hypothetical protein ACI4SS_03530 [Clostridia bacterium]